MLTTITLTRTSVDIPFYLDTLPDSDRELIKLKTIEFGATITMSDNQLEKTLTFDKTFDEFESWEELIEIDFPGNREKRSAYDVQHGMTIVIK